MGHEKTIVFIFIVSHFIIIILKKEKRFIICGNRIYTSFKMITCEHLRKERASTALSVMLTGAG